MACRIQSLTGVPCPGRPFRTRCRCSCQGDGVMSERADLVELGRYAFGRLRDRLAGLTEEEYRWEPGPGVSTLAWRMGHIAELLSAERNATWLGVAARPAPVG